jgi:hypothetical protein
VAAELRRVVARRGAADLDDLGSQGVGDRQLVDALAVPGEALENVPFRDGGSSTGPIRRPGGTGMTSPLPSWSPLERRMVM